MFSGIQLLARLMVSQPDVDARAGLRTAVFVSGYEGSPLGGLDITLQRDPRVQAGTQVRHVPAVNEELAATAVWGSQTIPRRSAQLDGVVGYWYGKAPGLDRSGDAIRHANFVGVAPQGGAVALVGDDPAAKSSTIPSASELAMAELCMPVLYPGDSQELADLARHAVSLSRWSGLWVGLKVVTDVADGIGTADTSPERPLVALPELLVDGRPWKPTQRFITLPPDSLQSEREVFYGRLLAAEAYAGANGLNAVSGAGPGAWIGLMAGGVVYQGLVQALDQLGVPASELDRRGIRLMRTGLLHPLDRQGVRRFAQDLETVVVLEEKRPFLEAAVRDCLYDLARRPVVLGKRDADGRWLVPSDGELTADRIEAVLRRVLEGRLDLPPGGAGPGRPRARLALSSADGPHRIPYFCSGCPHNRSTLVPDGALVGAGIGCHTMVLLSDEPNRKGLALTQMGGEGAQWIGQAPFSDAQHLFQNLGDGTLFHSGTQAIRACVAAGVDITYKLLYNRAVAMTGGQAPVGGHEVPELTRLLSAEGVSRMIVCTDDLSRYPKDARWADGVKVWSRDRLDEAQAELSSVRGVTVLVYDQQCAAEARRLRRRGRQPEPLRRVVINEAVCEGCGDCGAKSNCLSVHPVPTDHGWKTRIDQDSCNKDYSCLRGDCPSFLTVRPRRRRRPGRRLPPPEGPIPEPATKADASEEYSIFLTGIGGTGIVTVNALMALAAGMDGLEVTGLDQTGLSQKAGPVVSHLKLSPHPGSRRVGRGRADCWLVFDLLVAVEDNNLELASPERTVAVVSTSQVPTGAMVREPGLRFPSLESLTSRLESRTRADRNRYLDALELAERLVGNEVGANVLLLGVAYQMGLLPLSALALEKAIEANGVAVEMNLAAFRWGRILVDSPQRVPAPGAPPRSGGPGARRARARAARRHEQAARLLAAAGLDPGPDELRNLLVRRTAELIAYQGRAVARSYLEVVGRALAAEARAAPGQSRLSEAVARNLFKLTAYKDEYEVARLHLSPELSEALEGQFPEGVRISYHLHPPVLRALGMRDKIEFGSWFAVVFRLLYALRFLRGSWLDPFGHTRVRRTERALLEDYRARLERALADLGPDGYEGAVRLASLPEMVRGYEEVKLASVARYRQILEETQPVRTG